MPAMLPSANLTASAPRVTLPRLDHAAFRLPVYASMPGSPPDHVTLGSGWWPALAGSGFAPAGSQSRFPSCLLSYMSSPFHQALPGAIAARDSTLGFDQIPAFEGISRCHRSISADLVATTPAIWATAGPFSVPDELVVQSVLVDDRSVQDQLPGMPGLHELLFARMTPSNRRPHLAAPVARLPSSPTLARTWQAGRSPIRGRMPGSAMLSTLPTPPRSRA